MSLLGYLLLYLTLDGDVAYNFGGVLMSYFVVGIGVQLATIAILSSNLKNFPPTHRGRVLGLMGLSIALAGAFYGLFFHAFFRIKVPNFLLFLAIINCLLCVLGAVVISVPKEKQYSKNWKQMLRSALGAPQERPENTAGLMAESESGNEEEAESGEDVVWRPKKILGDLRFWLIFAMGFFGTSVGVMFLSVLLGSVYASHGGIQGGQAIAVIFGGVANAAGRLVGGVITDATLHLFKRSAWAFPCYTIMAVGVVLMMTVQSYDIVLASSILIGLGYGALGGGIFPSLVADAFGVKHYAKNFSLLAPAYPLGFLVWGQVGGLLYERQVAPGQDSCLGFHCHRDVFILMLVLLAIAAGATVTLTYLLPPATRPLPPSNRFVQLNDEFVMEMERKSLERKSSDRRSQGRNKE